MCNQANLATQRTRSCECSSQCHHRAGFHRLAIALIGVLACASAAFAQTAALVVQPVRITVPVNTTTSNGAPFTATVAGVLNPVVLSAVSLPTGATASFDTNNLTTNAVGVMTIDAVNLAEGLHSYAVEASGGAVQSLGLSLQSAHIWTGATFTNGGTASFADPGNWLNSNVPGATADVVLKDSSGQDSGILTTNILIASDTEIGSLRSAVTAGATRRHNIQINDGVTLRITGAGGLSVLRDRSDTTQEWQLAFTGQNGTLMVANPAASILTFNQANQNGRLLMDGLGLFVADIYRFAVSDYRSYPNYDSMKTNGYTGNALPQQGPPGHNYLARTNIIKSSFPGDANDWNDPAFREYSMVICRNEANGSTQRQPFRLGISNLFLMNSICLAGSASAGMDGNGAVVFNPAFTASNCVAIFRGPGGMNDRMAMFALADGAGPGASSGASKSTPNFSGGTVDMLLDRLYLSRERTNSSGSPPSSSPSATLTMGNGIIDVNHVILGYQGQGDNQGPGAAFCQGTLTILSNGTVRVNQTLELGYTTAAAAHTTQAEQGFGQVNVSGNGLLLASNITVGGVTKLSANNRITLATGGTVIVTNQIAASAQKLAQLSMSNSRLVLHVNGTLTDPYVYVTNLITSGSSNVLQIAAVTGLTADPQTIKLIAYDSAAPNFTLQLPAGLYGYLENDTVNKTINAVITTVAPKAVVWNGNLDGNWNSTTANWQGGLVFFNGDSATFDDSATGTRNINVPASVSLGAGGVLVSNAGPTYSFTGAGLIAGTSTMIKAGAGGLSMDTASQLPLTINGGAVAITSFGSVGLTTVDASATLANAGNVNGLRSSGTAVNTGTITANGVTVSAGTFANSGTVNGALNASAGATATNTLTGQIITVGTSTIASNAVLANLGGITNTTGRITINGLLTGNGSIRDIDYFSPANPGGGVDGRLQIASGATFAPGNSIGSFLVEGRFDLDQNANLVIEVNKDTGTHDQVICDYWGAIRGNIVMTNLGTIPFAAGDSFHVVSNSFSTLNDKNVNPNRDFKFVPPSPGLGLLWDGTDLFTNGIARIKTIPSAPTSLTTALVANTNQMTLSWPAGYIGWELQQQIRQLTNGISVLASDWSKVANSDTNNQVTVTINTNNQAVFYRLAHPTFY